MTIIFAGTPDFAVPSLRALVENGYEVPAVYTQPDRPAGRGRNLTPSPVKRFAQERGIEVRTPVSLAGEEQYIDGCELLVVVAYGLLLPGPVLDAPRCGCINVHASLLPRWRGAAPIQRAIEAGDEETGVCIMQMEAGLDTGPVFLSKTSQITAEDTAGDVHDRLAELGARALIEVLPSILDGLASPATQDSDKATYARKLKKGEAEIDWSQTAANIHDRVRAFSPWPVCQSWHGETRLRVWRSRVVEEDTVAADPGQVVEVTDDAIVVQCGRGLLALIEIQREGAGRLSSREFLQGYQLGQGDMLEVPA